MRGENYQLYIVIEHHKMNTTKETNLLMDSSCSFTMWASCWKIEPNSTMVDSMLCIVSARSCTKVSSSTVNTACCWNWEGPGRTPDMSIDTSWWCPLTKSASLASLTSTDPEGKPFSADWGMDVATGALPYSSRRACSCFRFCHDF